MQYIIEWTNCIISVTILFTIVELIIPDGSQKKTILMVTGIMTTIAIATPVIELLTDDFQMSEVFNLEEYFADFEISTDEIVQKQVEQLEKTYSDNILKAFNDSYPEMKIDECRAFFSKDIYGKIEKIDRLEVITQIDDKEMKEKLAQIAEIDEENIIILVMPK
ncbi:MAG: hypothetical protein E7314_03750 [Clostridiales bacterium]|nr:hypothetical protein [Clostridiales bacterium]